MSSHTHPESEHAHPEQNGSFLTPHGKKKLRTYGGRAGLVGAGVLAAIAAIYGPSSCSPKNYDAMNQQGLSSYDNNSGEITMARLFAAAHMFEANNTPLVDDSFNNLYHQIDRTLDQNGWEYVPFTSNAQNSHGIPVASMNTSPNPAFDSYHCYIGINKKGDEKQIIISWHNPEPSRQKKAQDVVGTHKVVWSHRKGQKVVQRTDYFADGRVEGPKSRNFDQFITALGDLQALYK